ncbi:uncharacterized protein BDCG_04282 [Blastomyces dermatitidis ER-3]|uniref:Uncharacterized protein n=1 Tax=Ajellomyces dermatitidis (strain ER-3 / ATCC MYA-2586) TaxID=559297 RepID=A0ABP2F0G8_AJEDR|nr:uncharacterized protein BDCG_04282 [Blastomyces dermatitidis ER-3]EEQ89162.1 hypothetical protein BDCG_04282 [Blastomyces dermatitidis ER-3]
MGSYIIMLIEEGGIATAAGGAEDKLNADTSAGRRDNTSLQGTATSTVTAREAEEDVTMRAVLSQLIDITAFNLAFLTVTEAAAAPQRCLLTRKCQNKPSTVLQE